MPYSRAELFRILDALEQEECLDRMDEFELREVAEQILDDQRNPHRYNPKEGWQY